MQMSEDPRKFQVFLDKPNVRPHIQSAQHSARLNWLQAESGSLRGKQDKVNKLRYLGSYISPDGRIPDELPLGI